MDFQNYQETIPTPQNIQITDEPVYTTPNNQVYPSQICPSNSQQNQFDQNSQHQNQNQNCNIIYQKQITPNDQYILIPQDTLSTPFEGNILEIPFKKTLKNYCFFIFIFISIILNFLPTIVSHNNCFVPLILIIETIILICLEYKKIVIKKDESKNNIYILLYYYFLFEEKNVINLNNISFNVIYSNQKYILLIFNNFGNRMEIDEGRKALFQFLYIFENIDVNKFNDQIILVIY